MNSPFATRLFRASLYPRNQVFDAMSASLNPNQGTHPQPPDDRRSSLSPQARLTQVLQQLHQAANPQQAHDLSRINGLSALLAQDPAGAELLQAVGDELETIQDCLEHSQRLEAIGQLAAGIAHEINTPIQYISDNTSFLQQAFRHLLDDRGTSLQRRQFIREQIPEALAQIVEGLQRVILIVSGMKRLSRVSDEAVIEVDLHEIVDTACLVSRNEWKYCAEIQTHFEGPHMRAHSKPQELYTVLLNLVINSAHAIQTEIDRGRYKRGQIDITVTMESAGFWLRVHDNGCGIDPAIRQRIFQPFFTTKPVGQGTGQGLAILKTSVETRLGGHLELRSCVGDGTQFDIWIPCGESAA